MKRFIVTIGRQYGSGGRAVGECLAKRLGIPVYGKEELMELEKGKSDYEEVRAFYEEQPVGSLLFAIAMNQGNSKIRDIPFRRIREICGTQSCVLIGRCGNYIFKNDANCVKIFIYAGLEEKVRWLENREGLSRKKALNRIRETEENRIQFYRYYTGGSREDINGYDLCIDAGILGLEKTVDMICVYLENRGLIGHE